MNDKISLSNAEWRIMNLLWKSPSMTITDMVRVLNDETEWTKHTVISLLKRLELKCAVTYKVRGRTKFFSTIIDRDESVAEETRLFVDKVFEGSVELMMTSLIKQNNLSEDQAEELFRILSDAEVTKK